MNGRAAAMSGERMTAEQAIALIPAGAAVFLEQGACEPLLLHRAILKSTFELRLLAAPVTGLNDCAFGKPEYSPRLHPTVFVSTPLLAGALAEGRVEYMPLHWSEVIDVLRDRYRPRVALLQVSPPDEEGYCSLGANAAMELAIAHLAEIVIAEINPRVPVVAGDTALHESRIACYVEVDYELRSLEKAISEREDEEIAANVDSLIADGSTLQLGIGKIPDAVMRCLQRSGKKARFHSGILTDSMMEMAQSRPGPHEDGEIVAGMLVGTSALYEASDRNPRIRLRSTEHTHSQAVMARIERFVAVNSAIEVDLLGQVNAESILGRQISGVGGQVDFFRGARASRGGRAIVAMPSSSRKRSRIVSRLPAGVPVSTSRVDYDFVVTEYGVAEMRSRTVAERAEALIQIAAPEHRQQLRESMRRLE